MSIYKEKNDKKWRVEIRTKDKTGKKIRKKKTGFDTKKQAEEFEREFINKIMNSSNITFKSLYEIYFEDVELKLKVNSISTKKAYFRKYLLPFFENYYIDEIVPNDIRKFQNELIKNNLSKNTLRAIENNLKTILNFAIKYYDLPSNPMAKIEMVGSRKNKKKMLFWNLQEFNQFIEVVDDLELKFLFTLLFWTGMRIGEVLALTFKDIDLNKKKLNINKTFTRLNKTDIITAPKTESSIRKIDLTENVINLFKEYAKTFYKPVPSTRIFTKGKVGIRLNFIKYIEQAKVKKIVIHDLRHSHASLLINNKVNILAVAKRLGHEDIKMTLNTYSHLYDEENQNMINILNNL